MEGLASQLQSMGASRTLAELQPTARSLPKEKARKERQSIALI
jgi:hypothetical protein